MGEEEDDVVVDQWGGDYSEYEPIYMTRTELESSVKKMGPQEIIQPGKLYIFGDYIFLNEKYKGIHIINNTDPINPQRTGFLKIPGNVDIAVKGNVIYADNAVDMVSVSLNIDGSIAEINRVRNIFPGLTPPDLDYVPYNYDRSQSKEPEYIVAWASNNPAS